MKIVIFGCGGHARSIAGTLLKNNKNAKILFVDSSAETDERIMGFEVRKEYEMEKHDSYIIAVGDNSVRKKMYDALSEKYSGACVSVISNLAFIGIDVYIGEGTFAAPYAYIGPFAKIGSNTIINTGSIIEHETTIGSHTHIAPHATVCGRSNIGNNVFCGAGSTVIDKISVCDNVVIGAGAVVTDDIVEAGIYVGVPAKKVC